MQQSRARMLTAYTCSDTFSNRFNSTSDGSHSSLHATFLLTFRTYTLSRITVQAYACTSGYPPARSSPPLLGGRTIGRADRPCQHVCNHRCDRIPKVRKLPRSRCLQVVPLALAVTTTGCSNLNSMVLDRPWPDLTLESAGSACSGSGQVSQSAWVPAQGQCRVASPRPAQPQAASGRSSESPGYG